MTPTIGEALDLLADREPGALAVDDGRVRLDRRDLQHRSRRVAGSLVARGARIDDLVAVLVANDAASVAALCGVWRAGATPLPLRADADPAAHAAVLAVARPRLVLDPAADGSGSEEFLPPIAARSWKAQPTSGSTGPPKVVLSAVPARVDPDRRAAPFLPLAARQLVAAPLAAAAQFTYSMRGLTTGHGLVLLPRFEPAAALDAIAAHRITWTMLPPALLHRLDRHAGVEHADLSSLEQVVHLGAPIDEGLKRRWLHRVGPERLTEVYAGAESNGVLAIRGDEWLAHPGSVGRSGGGTEVRVVDGDGRVLPAGVAGRVELRRANGPAYRYLGRPALPPGAWDTLGDIGYLDADGYLHLIDRSADIVRRDGVPVAPAAVELGVERHPAVRSAVAVGVPDPVLGQRVHVIADIAEAEIAAPTLLTWARVHVDPAPDTLEVVRSPLRDDAGKVHREDLRPTD